MMKKLTICLAALVFGAMLGWQCSPAAAEDNDGFQSLFDGETLKGWDGNKEFWSVKDGTITGQTTAENPTKGNTFLIWQGGNVGDFELRLKFRLVGGNSGIQYRSTDLGDFVVGGYQADMDSGLQYTGILYEERGRGFLAQRGTKVMISESGDDVVIGQTEPEKVILDSIKKEDWNEYTIIAQGSHLVQKLNGHTTVDVTDNQASRAKADGVLALQLHAGPPMLVQFKDIELKQLK